MNTVRILEVAEEQATLVEERCDHYREELIRCLISVITTQDEGLSEKGRRDKVAKIVEAFGAKVAASGGRNS